MPLDIIIIINLSSDIKFKKLLILWVIYYQNIKKAVIALIDVGSYQGVVGDDCCYNR